MRFSLAAVILVVLSSNQNLENLHLQYNVSGILISTQEAMRLGARLRQLPWSPHFNTWPRGLRLQGLLEDTIICALA